MAVPVIGQSYSLLCRIVKNVSGLTGSPTTQWFDSKGLAPDRNAVSSTRGQSTLTFSPLKTSHAGSYRCEGSVSSPALTQPLVTDDTWNLTLRSKSHNIPYYEVFVLFFSTSQYPVPESH